MNNNLTVFCATGRAAVQPSWNTITERGKRVEWKAVYCQPGQRIVFPLLPPPPCSFTFKPSDSTRTPMLLKAMQKHAVLFFSLAPEAQIRGNKTNPEDLPAIGVRKDDCKAHKKDPPH